MGADAPFYWCLDFREPLNPYPTTRIPNSSSPRPRACITKIRMAISWKRRELSEIRWCQNDRKKSEYKQARKPQDAQAES